MKPKIQVETCLDIAIQQLDPTASEALPIGQIVERLQAVIVLRASKIDLLT